ncbi:hypothetical protein E2C01_029627 [Portunus trituberculatus]|uniref:Uncharacterized protein n=1 Tax=Portunus trituberculatus TaxID=210409 RepID=A0A5B7ESW9_PORTR|nr:hypothetical protein [Portunus trituberculatus]
MNDSLLSHKLGSTDVRTFRGSQDIRDKAVSFLAEGHFKQNPKLARRDIHQDISVHVCARRVWKQSLKRKNGQKKKMAISIKFKEWRWLWDK